MTKKVNIPENISATQAAKLRGVSRVAINDDIHEGKLKAELVGSAGYIIKRKDFDSYMKKFPVDPSKQH